MKTCRSCPRESYSPVARAVRSYRASLTVGGRGQWRWCKISRHLLHSAQRAAHRRAEVRLRCIARYGDGFAPGGVRPDDQEKGYVTGLHDDSVLVIMNCEVRPEYVLPRCCRQSQ